MEQGSLSLSSGGAQAESRSRPQRLKKWVRQGKDSYHAAQAESPGGGQSPESIPCAPPPLLLLTPELGHHTHRNKAISRFPALSPAAG